MRLLLFLRGLKYDCSSSERYYCSILYKNFLPIAKDAVEQECAGQAWKVSERIADIARRIPFDGYDAMSSVHAPVIGVNRYRYTVSGIITPYDIVAFIQGEILTKPEHILYNRN